MYRLHGLTTRLPRGVPASRAGHGCEAALESKCDNRENNFTEPYADSAGAGAGAGADAGADACLPMNSAIHSSEAPNDP